MSTADTTLRITAGPAEPNRKRTVIAHYGGREVRRDEFNTDAEASRLRYARSLAQTIGQPSRVGDYSTLIVQAAEEADQLLRSAVATGEAREERKSQSATLVELAADIEFFHTADEVACVTIDLNGRKETHQLKSKRFRQFLCRRFHEEMARVPGSQALEDAVNVLAGRALFDGPEHAVHVRLAEHDGAIYLDLGDDDRQVVRITAEGWSLVADPPVKFIRRAGMCGLPTPERGGSLSALDAFLNVAEGDGALLYAWLVATLRPRGPYPVLSLNGEHGTAKSTTARLLRRLVDPNKADLRSEPRNAQDLMIAANNSRIVALDNLSRVLPWCSDALCRLATGGGFGTRELYSNDDEFLIDVQRPVIINGIGGLATRSDLLDRCILITLLPIAPAQRRTEEDLHREFDAAHPLLLGALLDAVVTALRRLPSVQIAELPRMADFARWAVAAEPSLPCAAGAFLSSYGSNQVTANEAALEGSNVAGALRAFMDTQGTWAGTATSLFDRIVRPAMLEHTRHDWPANSQQLSVELRRIAPNLRAVGITIEMREHSRPRLITIRSLTPALATPPPRMQAPTTTSNGSPVPAG